MGYLWFMKALSMSKSAISSTSGLICYFLIFSLPHTFSDHHFTLIIFRFSYEGENQGRSKKSKNGIWPIVLEIANLQMNSASVNSKISIFFIGCWSFPQYKFWTLCYIKRVKPGHSINLKSFPLDFRRNSLTFRRQ